MLPLMGAGIIIIGLILVIFLERHVQCFLQSCSGDAGIGIGYNNNNNNNRISIPPSVVTSEAVAEPVRSRKSAIVG